MDQCEEAKNFLLGTPHKNSIVFEIRKLCSIKYTPTDSILFQPIVTEYFCFQRYAVNQGLRAALIFRTDPAERGNTKKAFH